MFDVKKFTAFIAFNDEFRNLYYDIAESNGINSNWDVYQIQESKELPKESEIKIMEDIYEKRIRDNRDLEHEYNLSDIEFRAKIAKKVRGL